MPRMDCIPRPSSIGSGLPSSSPSSSSSDSARDRSAFRINFRLRIRILSLFKSTLTVNDASDNGRLAAGIDDGNASSGSDSSSHVGLGKVCIGVVWHQGIASGGLWLP